MSAIRVIKGLLAFVLIASALLVIQAKRHHLEDGASSQGSVSATSASNNDTSMKQLDEGNLPVGKVEAVPPVQSNTATPHKTITPKALAECIFAAAQTYVIPPSVLLGILNVEGGRIGQTTQKADNSYDLGPMQINSSWIPELASYWGIPQPRALQEVSDDACINIGVGAWLLRKKMNDSDSLYQGIASFYSSSPEQGHDFQKKVVEAMQRYRLVRKPDDLIATTGDNAQGGDLINANLKNWNEGAAVLDASPRLDKASASNLQQMPCKPYTTSELSLWVSPRY